MASVSISSEVLVLASVTLDEYSEALEVSNKGSVVILKREPSEYMVSNYNGPVMLACMASQYGFTVAMY